MRSPAWEGDWPISQLFGVNPQWYVAFGLAGHNGIDVAMPLGTALFAPLDATVVECANDQAGYGLYVKLTSGGGQDMLLAHLSAQEPLAVGAVVTAGTPLGRSGSTGNSTGPHLHFGWRLLNADFYRGWPYNGYVDPRQFLDRLQGGLWPPS